MSEIFSLHQVVQGVADASGFANPLALVDEIVDKIPAADLPEALRQALRVYVRHAVTRDRTVPSLELVAAQVQHVETLTGGDPPRSPRSWKVSAIQMWDKSLRGRHRLGERWVFLGDCAYKELYELAELRYVEAGQSRAQGDRFKALGDLLRDSGAATLEKLPEHLHAAAKQHLTV